MGEAYIVATARSPIGRAFKGSLKDVRPDDLAASMVRATNKIARLWAIAIITRLTTVPRRLKISTGRRP